MEIWKSFADGYEVSTAGNIKSTKRHEPHLLKPTTDRKGYLRVCLQIGGEQKTFKVHRLVAQAFIPNTENKREVNHLNGIKTDNRVENLEWVTPSENIRHAFATGLSAQGEVNYNAKLTNEQIVYIRNNPNGLKTCALAEKFGVDQTTISAIQLGKRYKSAGGNVHESKVPRVPDNIRDEIRRLYVRGSKEFGSTALAEKFGVSQPTILKIVKENHQEQLQSHVRD